MNGDNIASTMFAFAVLIIGAMAVFYISVQGALQ